MKAAALRNSSADAKASLATRGLGPRGLDRGGGVAVFAMFMVCVAFLCFQFWLCNQWAADLDSGWFDQPDPCVFSLFGAFNASLRVPIASLNTPMFILIAS